MNERDFELNGKKFKLNKIDAFKQFHVVRRIAPILSELLPAMKGALSSGDLGKLSEDEKLDKFAAMLSPLMNGLSRLSDKDSEMVLLSLLSSVEMGQDPAGWAKVSTGEMLMFKDLELPILLQLAGRAFMYNMSGFFSLLPQVSK